jgi:hypothetical protein
MVLNNGGAGGGGGSQTQQVPMVVSVQLVALAAQVTRQSITGYGG